MTTLRQDLARHVEAKDKTRLQEIQELFEDIKGRVEKVISQKTILRVPCQKEEDDLEQVEANLKLVIEARNKVKEAVGSILDN